MIDKDLQYALDNGIIPVTPIEKTPKGVNLSHLWSLCF